MSTTIKLASGYRHNGVLIIKSAKKAYKWAVVDRISKPVGFDTLAEAKAHIDGKVGN
tara:strand:+ start:427 stop:597 length:171 start_codon:yes stop_codon:yes gene_type:complete